MTKVMRGRARVRGEVCSNPRGEEGEETEEESRQGFCSVMVVAYILKAKKFAEPLFQSKKLQKKCVNPGVNFGPFGVILGNFWAILDYFGSF